MFDKLTHTCYAPARRHNKNEMRNQFNLFLNNKPMVNLSDSISQMVIILNEYRQIVYANEPFRDFCDVNDNEELIGKRPGEAVGCINATVEDAGCGTSEFCRTCGAVNAILMSQSEIRSTKECSILTTGNNSCELRVTSTPFELEGKQLTVFSIIDISAEKRKESLERVFLHDIMNSAGGIEGLSNILKDMTAPSDMLEISKTIEVAANNLIDEINIQKELSFAERGILKPNFSPISSFQILNNLKNIYLKHKRNKGTEIEIQNESVDVIVETDTTLLKRVLGNMIKNALEANHSDDLISLKSTSTDYHVRFSVHNKSYIKPDVQLQLFSSTCTTKGVGRGLGTYSMKLLGENYLNGKVWFESDENLGTTFYIELKKEN